jgi:hypothetical protein
MDRLTDVAPRMTTTIETIIAVMMAIPRSSFSLSIERLSICVPPTLITGPASMCLLGTHRTYSGR